MSKEVKAAQEKLDSAILSFESGVKRGSYVHPKDTNHINWRSGQSYNRMLYHISDLRSRLEEALTNQKKDEG